MGISKKEYIEAKKDLFGETSIIEKVISSYINKSDLAEQLLNIQPLYYDPSKIWWMWNKEELKWEITDETDILNFVGKLSFANTINSKQKNEILEVLKQKGRLNKPKEVKPSWIQFGNKIYDLETKEEINASPEYFVTNPIKWEFGTSEKTPGMDLLFESWVGKDHIQELYEILAFCLVPNYFIHRMFCLIGSGANGKSTYLKILEKFIGEDNVTSSSLYLLLKQRFEGSKLYKKLVCLMGETSFDLITNTDYLKKLSGEDMVRAEFKGKNGFDFRNYAKLIMATNSLPPTADKTIGFYRRWKIIKFPNKFDKETDILINVLEEEYKNLSLKCFKIVKKLWKKRVFVNDGTFETRKKDYEEESNPLMKHIKEEYLRDINGEIFFQEFFEGLNFYLEERGYRTLSAIAVSKQLKVEGFDIKTLSRENKNGRFIIGIKGKS